MILIIIYDLTTFDTNVWKYFFEVQESAIYGIYENILFCILSEFFLILSLDLWWLEHLILIVVNM